MLFGGWAVAREQRWERGRGWGGDGEGRRGLISQLKEALRKWEKGGEGWGRGVTGRRGDEVVGAGGVSTIPQSEAKPQEGKHERGKEWSGSKGAAVSSERTPDRRDATPAARRELTHPPNHSLIKHECNLHLVPGCPSRAPLSSSTIMNALPRPSRHIAIDCPLFKLGAEEMQPGFEPLVWAALNGLRPSKEVRGSGGGGWEGGGRVGGSCARAQREVLGAGLGVWGAVNTSPN